jgi:hypothetical protein
MPLIAYKTQSLDVFHVQTRRIGCEMCREPFTYLVWGTFREETTGLPVISSDKNMSKALVKGVEGRLSKLADRRNAGTANCPHCGRPQSWMLGSTYASKIAKWALGLGLLGVFLGAVAGVHLLAGRTGLCVIGFGILGVGIGALIGYLRARAVFSTGGQRDPRSMTDEEFGAFLRECVEEDADHTVHWYRRILKKRTGAKTMVVSLGFLDVVGGFKLPEGFDAEEAPAES